MNGIEFVFFTAVSVDYKSVRYSVAELPTTVASGQSDMPCAAAAFGAFYMLRAAQERPKNSVFF